jgi:putative glutamine amidotransferase
MRIGLVADINDNKFLFNRVYFDYARRFSTDVLLISPLDEEIFDIDFLMLPGGADVLPLRYGKVLRPGLCGTPNWNYEFFDSEMLPYYIENKVKIFGICRGLQTLNVHFNGTLHQHVFNEPYSSKGRDEIVHSIITNNSQFLPVNSLHHQTINKCADDFEPIAWSFTQDKNNKKEKKLKYIEAIKHKYLPIAAVQFHPEELITNRKADETTSWVDSLILSL